MKYNAKLIIRLYNKGWSCFNIAKKIGHHETTISKILRKNRIKLRSKILPKYFGKIPIIYFSRIKRKAKIRNLEFEISIKYIDDLFKNQKGICKISGLSISFDNSTASLDRIDSKKGYIKNNCQWLHKDINYAKQSLSDQEFIELCRAVSKHNDK